MHLQGIFQIIVMEKINARKRIKQIAAVFISHGFKKGINNPKQLRLAFEELGPSFVKIGQILSTRPDILPHAYIEELQKLQDDVKPESYEVIEKVITTELKKPISEIFVNFSKTPIASASLAQVHLATLKNGTKVVVKVQRPKVKEIMLNDIYILGKVAPFINFTTPGSAIDIKEVVEELKNATEKELDFLNEAENIKRFYKNNKDVKFIVSPQVYDEYTTSSILVMEYIDGIKIDNIERLNKEGYDLKDIASKLAYNYCQQIFEHGFFHADPHPGNILIHANKIGYLDFGLMGDLSENLQKKFTTFLEAIASRDISSMTKSVIRIGLKRGKVDSKKLYSDIEHIYNEYIDESLFDFDLPQMLDEIFKACKRNNIYMPKDVTLLLKGLMTLEGLLVKISPEFNIMDIITPYVKNYFVKNKLNKINWVDELNIIYSSAQSTLKLPTRLLELINYGLSGKLKANIELSNLEKHINQLNKMVNRIVFGMIVAGLLIGSSIVINSNVGPKFLDMSIFGLIGYVGSVTLGLLLLISILRSGRI